MANEGKMVEVGIGDKKQEFNSYPSGFKKMQQESKRIGGSKITYVAFD